MTVAEAISGLQLERFTAGDAGLVRHISGGYAGDLLSCAMAGANAGEVWVTLQAHRNVVAVAALTDVACVVITEGARPDAETVDSAERSGVTLLGSERDTFAVVAELARLGVPS